MGRHIVRIATVPKTHSTTSTMLVDTLAEFVTHKERFINAHWLNPAYLVPLVEMSPGKHTDPAVTAKLKAMLEGIGKVPVICAARPGYIVPRIQALAMNEAARMVEEGVASAEDLDKAIKYGFGFRFVQEHNRTVAFVKCDCGETADVSIGGEQAMPQRLPGSRPHRQVAIEHRLCTGLAGRLRLALQQAGSGQRLQVHHGIADRRAATHGLTAALAVKDGQGQVLDREVRAFDVGRRHPAARRRVVRVVQRNHVLNLCWP